MGTLHPADPNPAGRFAAERHWITSSCTASARISAVGRISTRLKADEFHLAVEMLTLSERHVATLAHPITALIGINFDYSRTMVESLVTFGIDTSTWNGFRQ